MRPPLGRADGVRTGDGCGSSSSADPSASLSPRERAGVRGKRAGLDPCSNTELGPLEGPLSMRTEALLHKLQLRRLRNQPGCECGAEEPAD